MDTANLKEILTEHDVRITDCRLGVLNLFINNNKALSQNDLEKRFGNYDRVTLYRTLNSFLKAGILHKIPNENGVASFGLCYDTCSPENHSHDHAHFKCNDCGTIECLETPLTVESIHLPEGYTTSHINLIVDGICKSCK